jgi:hypothetical protein
VQSRRLSDLLRFRHPVKFDFCRLTIKDLIQMLSREIKKDKKDPRSYRPIVAIGHTKDLTDFKTVEYLLSYLRSEGVKVSSFRDAYGRIQM